MAHCENEGWKVTAIGEMMVSRSFGKKDEPEFLEIRDRLNSSDVGYGHLEMNFLDPNHLPAPLRGDWKGSYMNADPAIANDIKWLGVDVMSLANNHSMDFGTQGLMESREICQKAGIACAGTGADLEQAGGPAYYECRMGRVALISASSGNKSDEWANLPKHNMPARPGINPLRVHTKIHVDQKTAEMLKNMGRELNMIKSPRNKKEIDGAKEFAFGSPFTFSQYCGETYVVDDKFFIEMNSDEYDLKRIIRQIKDTRKTADLVIVAHHFNVSEGPRGDMPTTFAQEFAHAAIDAGADMYFGHGWHRTLGIEIYKGKPIIYGMGNFFAQSQFLQHVPYDSFETYKHDMDKVTTLMANDEPLHPGLDAPNALWWNSCIYEYEFDEKRNIKTIKLTPLELGRDYSETEVIITRHCGIKCEGTPLIAHGENASQILERMRRLSALFGTEITIEGEVAYWRA